MDCKYRIDVFYGTYTIIAVYPIYRFALFLCGDPAQAEDITAEAFARIDPEIAMLIRAGTLEAPMISPNMAIPDDLEMKTMKRIRSRIRRQMRYVALATSFILMVPLVAMLFTNEVNWNLSDFIVMGGLLFGTGFTFVLISRKLDDIAYQTAVGISVVTSFLLIWINLAVGIIGSVDNPANLLYIGVLVIGIVGAGIARLQPRGMSYALFATALAQMLVPVIALLVWSPSLSEPPGIVGVFMINAFFAALFVVSALLFRRVVQK